MLDSLREEQRPFSKGLGRRNSQHCLAQSNLGVRSLRVALQALRVERSDDEPAGALSRSRQYLHQHQDARPCSSSSNLQQTNHLVRVLGPHACYCHWSDTNDSLFEERPFKLSPNHTICYPRYIHVFFNCHMGSDGKIQLYEKT